LKPTTQLSTIINKLTTITCLGLMPCALSYAEEDRTGLLLNGAISLEHTDNVLNKLETLAESDTAYSIKSSVQYLGLIGKHKIFTHYNGKYSIYNKNNDLDHNEHNLTIGAKLEHSHKINTEFKINFDKKIEEPGSTNASTINVKEFNNFENKLFIAKLIYGQYTSTGQLVFEYNFNDREFLNNEQTFRNRHYNQLIGTFFYRIAPKTRMLFQVNTAKYTYDDHIESSSLILNQSNKQNSYLIGTEWEATAKSTGTFKIGYLSKDYSEAIFSDVSGLSYELDMIWKPHPFTKISVNATRKTIESAQINSQGYINTRYAINTTHKLKPRTTVAAEYIFNNYDISNNRTDRRHTINFSVTQNLRTWLNVSLYYKYQERTSNFELFEYNSNSIGLTFETLFR